VKPTIKRDGLGKLNLSAKDSRGRPFSEGLAGREIGGRAENRGTLRGGWGFSLKRP